MKKKYLNYFLAIQLFCFTSTKVAVAQWSEGTCGNYDMTHQLELAHPELVQKRIDYDKALTKAVDERKNMKTSSQVYIIPIVFHILHVNGAENISDAQILAQVAKMNTDWRKLNSDTTAIVPSFVPLACDVHIEFRLAQKDPNGNCTNGIDRIYTHKTFNADENSKINQWPRDKYMNVWVVASIGATPGVAGYALYPSSVDGFFYPYDGVVMLASVCNGSSRVLTHEIAHCFSLEHTFGDTNTPGVNCGDDLVTDTPPTKGHLGTCPLADTTCTPGLIENVQNYMEYASCPVMFTIGQRDRMQAALNSPTAARNNLWLTSNLIATGTDGSGVSCAPVPDFFTLSNKTEICAGSTVTFTKNILNTLPSDPATLSWSFPGGSPATSAVSPATITYSTPGVYPVTLTATNSAGSNSTTKTNYIRVSGPADFMGPQVETFENTNDYFYYWEAQNLDAAGSNTWSLSNATGYSGSHSVMMTGYNNYFNDVDNLISASYNVSGTTTPQLTFRCAAASRATNTADMTEKLVVYSSIDCGASWSLKRTFPGFTATPGNPYLVNNGYHSEFFVPNSATQWQYMTVPLGGTITSPTIRFKFEYTSSYKSNNIYIDDVNIVGTNVGIAENVQEENSVSIYPNPTSQNATVVYHLNSKGNTQIQLVDILGKQLMSITHKDQTEGDYNVSISKQELGLRSGIYFIKLTIDNNTITKKLVITE